MYLSTWVLENHSLCRWRNCLCVDCSICDFVNNLCLLSHLIAEHRIYLTCIRAERPLRTEVPNARDLPTRPRLLLIWADCWLSARLPLLLLLLLRRVLVVVVQLLCNTAYSIQRQLGFRCGPLVVSICYTSAVGSMALLRGSLQQSIANLSPTTCSFAAHALYELPLAAPSLTLANWRETCLCFAVVVAVATVFHYFPSARTLSISSALA